MVKACVSLFLTLCLLTSPTFGMKEEESLQATSHLFVAPGERQPMSGVTVLTEEERVRTFDRDYPLPYLFRVRGKLALLIGTMHTFPRGRAPAWFSHPLLNCAELFLESHGGEESEGRIQSMVTKFGGIITSFIEKCGGIQQLLLPGEERFFIPGDRDFQTPWTQIVDAMELEGEKNLAF